MLRHSLIGLLVLLLLLQFGCALSPQQITIRPDLTIPVASYGAGQDLNVRAEDQRPTMIVGTRGGVYGDTSTIEIGNDYKTEIAYAISNGFSRWGFRSQVSANDNASTQVTVFLKELSYTPDKNPAIGKTVIKASVGIDVKQDGRIYHGTYEANGEMGYVTTPSQAKNNKQINVILNLALQKIFQDRSLVNFLQQ